MDPMRRLTDSNGQTFVDKGLGYVPQQDGPLGACPPGYKQQDGLGCPGKRMQTEGNCYRCVEFMPVGGGRKRRR